MPITQSRLHSLLEAAETLERWQGEIRGKASATWAKTGKGIGLPEALEALEDLVLYIQALPTPHQHYITIVRERMKYDHTAKANRSKMLAMRKRRAATGEALGAHWPDDEPDSQMTDRVRELIAEAEAGEDDLGEAIWGAGASGGEAQEGEAQEGEAQDPNPHEPVIQDLQQSP